MKNKGSQQVGVAVLVITVILMVAALLAMIFATKNSVLLQKSSTNQLASHQSFEAAEAGLEFGIVYLTANSATILANPVNGHINYGPSDNNITNIALGNNAKYSVVYTNPTQNNYNVILIKSTGVSPDGTSTMAVQQQVTPSASSLYTLTSLGDVTVNGHGGGVSGANAVDSGGNVAPNAASNGAIVSNDPNLVSMTGDALFMGIFGVNKATKESESTVYSNPGSVPWNSLTGSVWINGDVSISGNTTGGSQANPIVLIVNGNYTATGNATVNGIIYVTGNVTLKGNGSTGVLFTEGSVSMSGNGGVTYDSNIVNSLLSRSEIVGAYAKIPGSWKDF